MIAWTVRLFCWRQPMHVAIAQDGVVSTLDSDGLRVHGLAAWVAHQRLEAVVMIPSDRLDVAGMADRVSRPVLPVIVRRLTGLPIGRGDCVQIALESVCLACGYERPRGITTPKDLLAWTLTLPGSIGSTRSAEPTSSGSRPSRSLSRHRPSNESAADSTMNRPDNGSPTSSAAAPSSRISAPITRPPKPTMCFDTSPAPAPVAPAPAAAPAPVTPAVPKPKSLRIDPEDVAQQAATRVRRKRDVLSLRIDTGVGGKSAGTGLGI
jgi:hypothetical protein